MAENNLTWWTAKDVQDYYKISKTKFYELRKKGRIADPHYPVSPDMPRYRPSEIIARMEATKELKIA